MTFQSLVWRRMGAYLSEPVLEKHSEDGDSQFLSFGSSSMQGWRVSQEVGSLQDRSLPALASVLHRFNGPCPPQTPTP